jgi:alpha/beta superfamily hydrolase
VTIAPPVGRIITDPIARPDVPWLVVHGDQDELVAVATVRAWVAGYSPPPDLHVVTGGEHFFHGKLLEVRETLVTFFRS